MAAKSRIVQVTDTHLFASPDGELLGLNTELSMLRVLDLVATEQANIELILVTGDISQDGSSQSYARFNQHMQRYFQVPVHMLPGNHDYTDKVNQRQSAPCPSVVTCGNWRILMLDTSVPGNVYGALAKDQLNFLAEQLALLEEYHLMIGLHHHPVPINCPWLDEQMILNADAFWELVDGFENVRAVIWGHVHQQYEAVRDQVKLMAAPSTCIQFSPNSQTFAADTKEPGYRWFDLYDNGEIESGVSRLVNLDMQVDMTASGY